LGINGIPVSVIKGGIAVLAGPIVHVMNQSLATGVVPEAFKEAIVHPVHKGSGKSRTTPASYQLVSILPAFSKVLETIVKEDLEAHLTTTSALPNSQHGFRQWRSCTPALAMAHAKWMAAGRSKVIGVMAFNLSGAFDTVDAAQLLPKLQAIGVRGRAQDWFASYLIGGHQSVNWNGTRSGVTRILFGVRQGSILAPLLYLLPVADLPDCLGVGEESNSGYADDTGVWAIGRSTAEVQESLQVLADRFTAYTKGNGLALNAAKTQLLINGTKDSIEVIVDGVMVKPADTLELLGVKFNQSLTTCPHVEQMVREARHRATFVARLALHLPWGKLFRQLANGLLLSKLGHAIAADMAPRLPGSATPTPLLHQSVQVGINNVA
jgi:hypothetical protein